MFPTALKAEVWTPENLPMVHLQDSLRFVCDPDGVLSPETVAATDAILADLKLKKGVETVVVVAKRIAGGDAYQFGMDLSRKYGVGDEEQRTGLIIILSTEDRKYQFLTGNGLEGTLPDGLCYNIQQSVMVPALKAGNWDKAIYESVKAVSGIIMGDETITRKFEAEDDDAMIILVVIVITLIIFITSFQAALKNTRTCPKCKAKDGLRIVSSHRHRKGTSWYTQTILICDKCGHQVVREQKDDDDNEINSGSSFPPIFMSGGRGGGGGNSGGSFGGGSFGGGGSGGDF